MSKEEILNDGFISKEKSPQKNSKKLKIAIAIVTSIAIIATTTLLVGYFKFDWFKSEIYKIDAKINRNLYQANYFTETKTINTKIGFTSGVSENHEQKIYTNFMILQTDKKELSNHDFLNTANLIILDSKVEYENELKEVTSFNIFDQNKINEVKSSPNGEKYPMAVFSFYENGTISEIKLPNNMDNYNAKTIIELINNVIPQLTRNRNEDISNGIKISTKKDKNKKTIVESIAPEELQEFKGSRFVKSIERDIENEQLTNIRTKSNLDLETKLDKEKDEMSFGLQDFNYETKSNIVSTGVNDEDKQNFELIQELSKYYTFIKSDELLESFEKEETIIDKWEEVENDNNEEPQLRNLLNFKNFNADKTFTVKTLNVFGHSFAIKVRLGVKSGKAFGEVIIAANKGSITFGKNGITGSYSQTYRGEKTVLKFTFPQLPAVSLNLIGGGSITVSATLSTASKTLKISLGGSLYAKAEITAGWKKFASLSAGAKGTLVSASCSGTIKTNGSISRSGKLSAGKVIVYVKGKFLNKEVLNKEKTVYNGWSKSF